MFAVVLVLFVAVILVGIGFLAAMLVKDKPMYGVMGLVVLAGPGAVFAILTAAFQG
ncbi:hypothetical protein ACFFQW_11790 [Umezawaea endophytica]|uniref:Uncharacterized protein n=1 Tax=Umezawaea endophytica TaxID=1654476 RepID=A0A9X2VTD7_9PSEU|nr:hypothetical protein [Umezawaea endophytica]MCS7482478.1 hypothetical protein [Umezawaea endophytica]